MGRAEDTFGVDEPRIDEIMKQNVLSIIKSPYGLLITQSEVLLLQYGPLVRGVEQCNEASSAHFSI
jgi:hypothetical protein